MDSGGETRRLTGSVMPAPTVISGPAFPPERFAERLAETIRCVNDPSSFERLPRWTQRVMLILKDQLVPAEFTAMFQAEQAILTEGVCVAWMAHAPEATADPTEGDFARRVAEWLTRTPQSNHVVDQLRTGAIAQNPAFREHVMRRLFAGSAHERRAFAEGLALGNRVYDLFARQAEQKSTDATRVYLLLWLYWPEVAKVSSIAEAAHLLEDLVGPSRNLVGRNWDERFRKIANRIGLSYRAKQAQTKPTTAKSQPRKH